MYRCAADSTGQCNDNAETFVEDMHCERFKSDKTGPWTMISDGMSGSHCGEKKVKNHSINSNFKLIRFGNSPIVCFAGRIHVGRS